MIIKNLVSKILENGGNIYPLAFPTDNKTTLFNPSILIHNDEILINIRNCQYTLYHTSGKFESRYGPLCYLNPENDITLTTTNYLGQWKNNTLTNLSKIDTSIYDVKPLWQFVGLEDARLVNWENDLYLSGVRRDTTTNGEGRMELSKIIDNKEVSRYRIPVPFNNDSYCEKNWMPILDMPFHYVKWCNPVEVVKVNINGETEQIFLGKNIIPTRKDMRGGSQLIKIGNHRICIIHETDLWKNTQSNKDGTYRHRVIVFDDNWNIIKRTNAFDFMTGQIEFCSGLAEYENKILVTFGFSDNAAFLLEIPKEYFLKFVYEGIE
jgi:predicted GH43/DUF377 family glycosyl hydrolase